MPDLMAQTQPPGSQPLRHLQDTCLHPGQPAICLGGKHISSMLHCTVQASRHPHPSAQLAHLSMRLFPAKGFSEEHDRWTRSRSRHAGGRRPASVRASCIQLRDRTFLKGKELLQLPATRLIGPLLSPIMPHCQHWSTQARTLYLCLHVHVSTFNNTAHPCGTHHVFGCLRWGLISTNCVGIFSGWALFARGRKQSIRCMHGLRRSGLPPGVAQQVHARVCVCVSVCVCVCVCVGWLVVCVCVCVLVVCVCVCVCVLVCWLHPVPLHALPT